MKRLIILIAVLAGGFSSFIASIAQAESEFSPDETRIRDAIAEQRRFNIKHAEQSIADDEIAIKQYGKNWDRETKRAKLKSIKEKKADLKTIESTLYPPPLIMLSNLKKGQIGFMAGISLKRTDNQFDVRQVIDKSNLIVDFNGELIWITGVNTEAVVDGGGVRLPQLFEVTGSKTYVTVIGGSNTIFQLRPFAVQDFDDVIDRLEHPRKITRPLRRNPL